MTNSYVALDLETTGLDPERDRITEIGAVRFTSDGEELDTFRALVNPERPIPLFIQKLTGVTDDAVRNAPTIDELAPDLAEFVGEDAIVGQNVGFDLDFLRRDGIEFHGAVFDTARFSRLLMPSWRGGGLAMLAEELGVPAGQAHRAVSDARTAAGVFVALRNRAAALPAEQRLQLARLISIEDPLLAAEIAGDAATTAGVGMFTLPRPAAPQPSLQPGEAIEPVSSDDVEAVFAAGRRADALFQDRREQREMASTVRGAFSTGGHWLVEAGTGVGKSLAHLVPAALFALKNETRVVVSTNTINLQEQLLTKDVPALRRMLVDAGVIADEQDLRVSLLKGRSNYLCVQRFAASYAAELADPDFARLAASLLLWLPETPTGDRSELYLNRDDWRTWQRLSAQDADCLSRQNTYVREGRCFLQRARKAAEGAHIVIVNHALLLADIAAGGTAIPPFEHLVVDEAHNLEDQATQQFGSIASSRLLQDALDGLHRPASGGNRAGGVTALLRALKDPLANDAAASLERSVSTANMLVRPTFGAVAGLVGGRDDDRLLLTAGRRASPDWGPVEQAWAMLDDALASVHEAGTVAQSAPRKILATAEAAGPLGDEIETAVRRVDEQRDALARLISGYSDEMITWAARERGGTASLHSAPLDVGPTLWNELFESCRTVVATSATLATGTDMGFAARRLGLGEADTLQLGSPFDYERATLLATPTDVPEPNAPGYHAAVAGAVVQLARAAQGRSLVLFTSHAAMRETASLARSRLEDAGIAVLVQGMDGSPQQLTQNLAADTGTVVFGTSSFWEGVDIRGNALSMLIIARLPFAVPSDPVHQARSEQYGNPFAEYSLPAAILRFRQGFGRLIRDHDDRGVVVVLDNRLYGKRYGTDFTRALPRCTMLRSDIATIAAESQAWLQA